MTPMIEYFLAILTGLFIVWFASVFFFPPGPTEGNPPIEP